MSNSPLNVLLVDDHELVRSGLRMIIETVHRVSSVLEASSGEKSIPQVKNNNVDLVFMDMGLPGMDGFSTALRLLQINEDMKIIILTGLKKRPASRVVLQAGIRGYMTKSSAAEELSEAIDTVMNGKIYLSRDIAEQMALDSLKNEGVINRLDNLSRRELQVALLLMHGHKPGDVGDMLFLSAKTVSTYKRRAFEKLHVESMVQLVGLGLENGFLGQTP